MAMDETQTATSDFFVPLAIAYLAACGGWLAFDARRKLRLEQPPDAGTSRPYFDLGLTFAAVAGIFAWGEVYRRGWLLPTGDGILGGAGWLINNAVIYSPLAMVLTYRRQGTETIFLTLRNLPTKLALGTALGVVSVLLFLAARGETSRISEIATAAVNPRTMVNFVPVFLEGVAVAFIFVRLRWACGTTVALVLPALLFALAHVPGQMEVGRSAIVMLAFFAFNSALVVAILATVARSRDVIWIGMVHYLLDIAIRAI